MGIAMVWITATADICRNKLPLGGEKDIAGCILLQRCCQVRQESQLPQL